ncbi:hypothetical protein DPMN_060756 [Dreissena polymorpha]|uniref:Uncharacterized protein n=1 Tax=Dreissena polymorpha TaxID=45954 RepID=A0A9D4C6N9_DREPO|nr:hypothetical protein DPMN_060756 [Dreissena polymorpha]
MGGASETTERQGLLRLGRSLALSALIRGKANDWGGIGRRDDRLSKGVGISPVTTGPRFVNRRRGARGSRLCTWSCPNVAVMSASSSEI